MTNLDSIVSQRSFWNQWNASTREHTFQDVSQRQTEVVCGWLEGLCRNDLDIIDAGCGTGWLCPKLLRYGHVTGTDLSDEVLSRAQQREPRVKYIAGDFFGIDFKEASFDVVVTLELLSHVADQAALLRKFVRILRPGGHLMLATQNRTVVERYNTVSPPADGQLRRWVNEAELRNLLQVDFDVLKLFSVTPRANRGLMRIVNSYKLNMLIRAIVGERLEHVKERMGLGWTLMALARRRGPRTPPQTSLDLE